MKKFLTCLIALCAAVLPIETLALTGSWRGDLDLGVARLPLVFNFSEDAAGVTTCTMDSPQQNAKGIPAEVTLCTPDSVVVMVRMIGASYSGKVTPTKIDGTFSQAGQSFPLVLTPDEDITVRRPQTPQPPFPYVAVDTVFTAPDGVTLAGTFVMPPAVKGKKVPMVVMVSGSGPQNRDEELFEHRPFAVLADFLARNGIASFRYDDRGTAGSKGNFATSDIDDFKDDAEAALKFARTLGDFSKVGFAGHSEGGTIAMMLAAENVPDFVVSLSGLAVDGKECILEQNRLGIESLGVPEEQREGLLKLIGACFDQVIAGTPAAEIDVDKLAKELGVASYDQRVIESLKQSMKVSQGDYFRKLLAIHPAAYLGKIKCPMFAVNGTLDLQVNADRNLAAIRDNVRTARTKAYPGLNHLLQHATTGSMSEYGEIRETLSPEVLADITAFLLSLPQT